MNRTPILVISCLAAFAILVGIFHYSRRVGTSELPGNSVQTESRQSSTDAGALAHSVREPEGSRNQAGPSDPSSGRQERYLIVRGMVHGALADAVEPLSVHWSFMDPSGKPSRRIAHGVKEDSPHFEFRDTREYLAAILDHRKVRVDLYEGQRVLQSIFLDVTMLTSTPPNDSTVDVVFEHDLTFVSPAIITGVVVDSRDEPVDGANVALLAKDQRMGMLWKSVSKDKTSIQGSFRMTVRDAGEASLVIVHPLHEMRSMSLTIPESAHLDLGSIRLGSGVEISGVVRFPSSVHAIYPIADTRVVVDMAFGPKDAPLEDEFMVDDLLVTMVQINGQIARSRIVSYTDAAGKFTIRGLKQMAYRVTVSTSAPPRRDTCEVSNVFDTTTINAPASGLVLHFEAPLIVARVTDGGLPVPNQTVDFHQSIHPAASVLTNAEGRGFLFARPGLHVRVSTNVNGYALASAEVIAPERGGMAEVELKLHRVTNPASLVLDVVDFTGRPISQLACSIAPAGEAQTMEAWVRTVRNDTGHYTFGDLEPGAYLVEVRPAFWNLPDPRTSTQLCVPKSFSISLDANTTEHRRVTLERGAQIVVQVEDEHTGRRVHARCAIDDGAGNRVVDGFHCPDWLPVATPIPPHPVPEGTYTVVAEHPDYETARTTVTVETGRRVLAQVKMKQK